MRVIGREVSKVLVPGHARIRKSGQTGQCSCGSSARAQAWRRRLKTGDYDLVATCARCYEATRCGRVADWVVAARWPALGRRWCWCAPRAPSPAARSPVASCCRRWSMGHARIRAPGQTGPCSRGSSARAQARRRRLKTGDYGLVAKCARCYDARRCGRAADWTAAGRVFAPVWRVRWCCCVRRAPLPVARLPAASWV